MNNSIYLCPKTVQRGIYIIILNTNAIKMAELPQSLSHVLCPLIRHFMLNYCEWKPVMEIAGYSYIVGNDVMEINSDENYIP